MELPQALSRAFGFRSTEVKDVDDLSPAMLRRLTWFTWRTQEPECPTLATSGSKGPFMLRRLSLSLHFCSGLYQTTASLQGFLECRTLMCFLKIRPPGKEFFLLCLSWGLEEKFWSPVASEQKVHATLQQLSVLTSQEVPHLVDKQPKKLPPKTSYTEWRMIKLFFLSKSNSNLIDWFGNEGCFYREVI